MHVCARYAHRSNVLLLTPEDMIMPFIVVPTALL